MVVFGQKWLYWGKSGCIRAKVVVLGQKWLYSGKSGCIRAKVVVLGQGCFSWVNWCFLSNMVVFGQIGCFRQNRLYLGKNGCI